jgi:hypothetical protein
MANYIVVTNSIGITQTPFTISTIDVDCAMKAGAGHSHATGGGASVFPPTSMTDIVESKPIAGIVGPATGWTATARNDEGATLTDPQPPFGTTLFVFAVCAP